MTRTIPLLSIALLAAGAFAPLSPASARQGAFIARGAQGHAAGLAGARGAAVRGGRTITNADGSVTHQNGSAYRGLNGGAGGRTASTTINPDGSVSRSAQGSGSGPRGSSASTGGFARNADGSWSGSRSTSATSAATGVSYSGSTSIDPATGKPVHSGGCTDASGAAIACR